MKKKVNEKVSCQLNHPYPTKLAELYLDDIIDIVFRPFQKYCLFYAANFYTLYNYFINNVDKLIGNLIFLVLDDNEDVTKAVKITNYDTGYVQLTVSKKYEHELHLMMRDIFKLNIEANNIITVGRFMLNRLFKEPFDSFDEIRTRYTNNVNMNSKKHRILHNEEFQRFIDIIAINFDYFIKGKIRFIAENDNVTRLHDLEDRVFVEGDTLIVKHNEYIHNIFAWHVVNIFDLKYVSECMVFPTEDEGMTYPNLMVGVSKRQKLELFNKNMM